MAYNVKFRATHKEKVNNDLTTYEVEILEKDYSGSVTDVKGIEDVFTLNYEDVDFDKSPIQKGRLEFFLAIGGTTNYDGQSIIEEIFNADEQQYRMRLKINGSVYWTGNVLNDLLSYDGGEFTYQGKIVAKDLTRLKTFDFPFTNDRKTIIQTIAALLDDLGLDLDIYSYTSWINQNTTDSDDFLNQIYNDRYAIRQYARNGNETDEEINHEEALKKILVNYGLILRQTNNAWRLFQRTALENPTSVYEYRYDSAGVQQSVDSSKDLTQDVDKVARYILPSHTNQFNKAHQRVRVKFDHRTDQSSIQFPTKIDLPNDDSVYEQFFISDGDQSITIKGSIEAYIPNESGIEATATANIRINPTGYWWDGTSWATSVASDGQTLQQIAPDGDGNMVYQGNFTIDTSLDQLPTDADGTLKIELFQAGSGTETAVRTVYSISEFVIESPVNIGTSTDFQLTQSGEGYSNKLELADTWYGDGPVNYARSALRYSTNDEDTTAEDWQFRGTTLNYRNLHHNLTKEWLDLFRQTTKNLEGDLLGQYDVTNLLVHDQTNLFFKSGNLTGKGNRWTARFIELDVNSAGDDNFISLRKDDSNTGTTGEGSSSGGGGLTEDVADSKYFQQSNNLSEGVPATIRTNIDVYSTSEVDSKIAWGNISGTLSNQTDLQNALDGKADTGHTHTESDITDLGPYDNYQSWVAVDGASNFTGIGSGDQLNFNGSGGIGVSVTTDTITIDGSGISLLWSEITNKPFDGLSSDFTSDPSDNLQIVGYNNSNWDTAYSWGDHSTQGYLTGNETITISGDASGSGSTSISVSLNSNVVGASELSSNAIIGQTDLASLEGVDEFLVYDNSALGLKRIDLTILETYMNNNLNFGSPEWSNVQNKPFDDLSSQFTTVGTAPNRSLTIQGYNNSNWDTAYSWGDHSTEGYITGNETITLSGDASGSGATSVPISLNANVVGASEIAGNAITGQTDLTSLQGSDEFLVYDSDALRLKRIDLTVLQSYMQTNLSFGGNPDWTDVQNKPFTTINTNDFTVVSDQLTLDASILEYGEAVPWSEGGTIDINGANETGLYAGSTSNFTNRGPSGNNAGALFNIITHPGDYYSQFWFDTSNDEFYFRSANNTLPTGTWQRVWHGGNVTGGTDIGISGQTISFTGNYIPDTGGTFTGRVRATRFETTLSNDFDKIRVYPSSNYTIGFKNGLSYGGLNGYATTFTMNNDTSRGWLWRHGGMSTSQGAMSLTTAGVLTVNDDVTATDFIATSDARIKENEIPITNALESLRNITPYHFDKDGERKVGYIAQNIEEFTENVVSQTERDGYTDFRVMNLFGMQAYNSSAIKEVDDEVTQLKSRVEDLEERVKELGGEL